MAGFYGTDYFMRQAEMMQSSASDDGMDYHLRMFSLPSDSVQRSSVPKLSRASVSSKHASASSSTGSGGTAGGGTSLGFSVSELEENFLSALGISLKHAVQERECSMCERMQPLAEFIGTEGCAHKYCTGCCKAHADMEVLSGSSQIECPHLNCQHTFDRDQCKALLGEASFEVLKNRQMEVATSASQRTYCPYPDCGTFIPIKSESSSSAVDTLVECHACHRGLCLQCKVPWDRDCEMCGSAAMHKSFMGTWDCAHEYCTNCCKQHAELEILSGSWDIECPHPNCSHSFDIDQFKTVLSQKEFDILNTRQLEAAIPVPERVYCPRQGCGAFVPYVQPEGDSGCFDTRVECCSCHGSFCLDCSVPWETRCDMCAESRSHKSFMSTNDCAHKYCTDCCKQHAERKILSGVSEIECPHPNCGQNFDIAQCSTLLSEASFNILKIKQTEAATPASQRIYCPFPGCNVFVPCSPSGSSSFAHDAFVVCYACNQGFCLECKIPWHSNRTCGEYRAYVEKIERDKLFKEQALAEANSFERFGEEEASKRGGICRVSLVPSLNFQGLTPEECHFRLAESQFFRMSNNRRKKVTKVEFIKNAQLEERFNRKKEHFKKSNVAVEARIVFHGTDATAIDKIAAEGFKIGGQGVAIKYGASYGRGVYTAVNPDISVAYCRGSNMMLLSIAIPGELNKHYNHGGSTDVLVIRDVDQLLPRYVVHYS